MTQTNQAPNKKNAMLVHMSISQWYNQATDKKVSDEVAKSYGLEAQADRYVKVLIPQEALIGVRRVITQARQIHARLTLPWEGDLRVLPAQTYFEYVAQIGRLKEELETEAVQLAKEFRAWKDKAKANKKGMYDEKDFPTEAALKERFRIHTSLYPLPDAGDFNLEMDNESASEIRQNADLSFKTRLAATVGFLKNQIIEALAKYVHAVPKKGFRDSTVERLQDLVENAPYLNVTDDAEVERLQVELQKHVTCVSADTLRNNEDVKQRVLTEAKRILSEFTPAPQG